MKSFIQYILCDRIINNILSAFDILTESTQNRYKKFSIKIRQDGVHIAVYIENPKIISICHDRIEYIPTRLYIKRNKNKNNILSDLIDFFLRNGFEVVVNNNQYDLYNKSEQTMITYIKYITIAENNK